MALDYCEELWFARNMAFHKAGYCFGSNLGQAVFGNFGCVGKDVTLAPRQAAFVARLRASEAEEGCRVDTSAGRVSVSLSEARKRLTDQPFPSIYESACIGWRGGPLSLFAGRGQDAAKMATVFDGVDLLLQYEDADGYSFVEAMTEGEVVAVGWAAIRFDAASCEMMAG
ncbi:hypothetical protein AIOL_000325 [Candidatus Rhodobacter oscarellae]|uniref:YARHG domain-containing protein n=2 Tax=Candidatus Rhodobacter oscarellae TaxID=1675527 RepID=A0A0J9EBP0_9RHOB|nr:hypothetical protein AIOL_000325 [Candidatus Rhodobacter lobularis]